MATSHFPVLLLLPIFVTLFRTTAASDGLSIQFHHYFSDTVRQWEEFHGLPSRWHEKDVQRGSPNYYKMLIDHDLHRNRGRFLAEGDLYSFTNEGNETRAFLNLLHYANISLGTPSQTFLVMLDTGSHLFWVPCNCRQCAPNTSPSYGNVVFHNYMPNTSTTSKTITCSSNQCDKRFRNVCLNSTGDCMYTVRYAMADTASSGILMQDVLSFMNERNNKDILQLPIVFGCGEVQTGALLSNIPNGLMGLGLDSLAVPSMLAKNITISDSFSMCFGNDGSGRLKFGDKGNSSQNETPLVVYKGLPYYNINITGMVVGNKTIKAEYTVLVDSGTNFGLLQDPLYTQFAKAFNAQVKDKGLTVLDADFPLEYCYESNSEDPVHPSISFTTKGGNKFPMLAPLVGLSDENSNPVGYCLAVIKSSDNIIGAIAMTGLNVVYNREKLVLGWQEADCYGSFKTGTSNNTSSPPKAPSSDPQKPSNSWAQHVSASNLLNTLMCLFVMGLPIVLYN